MSTVYSLAQETAYEKLNIDDGKCQIATSDDLLNFASAVNSGKSDIDAILKSDIDLSDVDFPGIGTSDKPYCGTFDGQYHTITLNQKATKEAYSLFYNVTNGTIKNLRTAGTITTSFRLASGFCGNLNGSTIENCVSSVEIISSWNGDAAHAGFCGFSNVAGGVVSNLKNCMFNGKITGETSQNCAGLVNWCYGTTYITNCLQIGDIETPNGNDACTISRTNNCICSNVFYTNDWGRPQPGSTRITDEMIKSGEICYVLNGNQSEFNWSQTLGEDIWPIPFPTQKNVFVEGQVDCIGRIIEGTDYSFTNDGKVNLPEHKYENGSCTTCGNIDDNFCKKENGCYLIGTPYELIWLSKKVAMGDNKTDVKLTSDIDLSEVEFPAIGTSQYPFGGTFDGQYHTITLNQTANMQEYSLFDNVTNGCIKNLKTDGTITTAFRLTSGFCGNLNGSTIQNCISSVEIISSFEGDAAHAGFCGFSNEANGQFSTLKNCMFNGKIMGDVSYNSAGLVNWCYAKTYFENCLQIADITSAAGGDACTIARNGQALCKNVYFKNVWGSIQSGSVQITEDKIKSGEACFSLNGDQSDIQWTQNIDEDAYPIPFPSQKTVYIDGQVDCIGRIIEDTPYSFSNNGEKISLPPHYYENGLCTVCGQADSSILPELKDGFYQIETANQLNWFAKEVNEGNNTINGKLLADIDLTGVNFPMIGTTSIHYAGTFDGQNHTITLNQTAKQDYYGVFCIIENATIMNLRTQGDIITSYKLASGISGQIISSTIQNCISSVHIISSFSGDAAHGGITGWAINNCTIKNCLFDGSISGESTINCAGIVGWSEGSIFISNCLEIGEVNVYNDTYNIARNPSQVTCQNTYYLNPTAKINAGSTLINAEQLANGEVCWLLNADPADTQWTQSIGDELCPVPDPMGKQVYMCGKVTMNIENDEDFAKFRDAVYLSESEYCENVLANKEFIDQYIEIVNSFNDCSTFDELTAMYDSASSLRENLKKSEDAYSRFMAKVNEVKAYLDENNNMEGDSYDLLYSYLNDYEEPNNEYVNGSVQYITEITKLNEEELLQEMKWIDDKLNLVVISCPVPGTDVTKLLVNADFSEGFNGWQGQTGTGYGIAQTSTVPAAECWNNTMDMYQTLTGIKNGIYELSINGTFRPYPITDYFNTNYAAVLYANENMNYFQADIEDMLPASEAVDGSNCFLNGNNPDVIIEDMNGNLQGYCPWAWEGSSIAFQAGRYQNSILVNVTDGTLTVGIRQPGTANQPEWLGFGNVKLTYCGTIEESDDYLDNVLSSQSARAETILNKYEFSVGDDYSAYPNFSQQLKDELNDCLNLAQNSSDPAEKYTLIQKFSELFQKIYESKKDYVTLMKQYIALEDISSYIMKYLDGNDLAEMDNLLETLSNGYSNGSFGKEECNKNYLNELSFWPQEGNVYLINNVKDLLIFANYINSVNSSLDAELTNDIDLTDIDFPMIGTTSTHYSGTFNGNYHTITFNQTANQSYYGLFCIAENATIKNLHTAGDIYTSFNLCGGIAGQLISCTVQNCISSVNIISTFTGDAAYGGICGWSRDMCSFKDCLFDGTISGETTQNCAGFSGWTERTTFFTNCLQIGQINIAANQGDTYNISRSPYDVSCNNVYYLNSVANTNAGTIQISSEHLQSGEVCYLLNVDQSDIQWTQTLGEDTYPIPFPSQKQVYVDGDVRCDGMILGDVIYTNNIIPLPAHEFVNGNCSKCGCSDPNFEIDIVDGFYQISNTDQMVWFTQQVNNGNNAINACLTNDIDLSQIDFPMIGTDVYQYQGIFDGQNHTVTIDITAKKPITGLFYILTLGTVKNLQVNGSIHTDFNIAGGICGKIFGGTIQNCISSVIINSTWSGDAAHAGIVSVSDDYQGNHSFITDCLFNGSILGEATNCCAGIVGWCTTTTYITNCLQNGNIMCLTSGGNIIARNGNYAVCSNVFFKNYQGAENENTTHITDDQLTSGEVCFLLNGDQSDIQWTQNLGEDICPIPFNTKNGVTKNDDGMYVNYSLNGVSEISAEDNNMRKSGIYNLNGQRVSKTTNGIYIVNGRKVFFKK